MRGSLRSIGLISGISAILFINFTCAEDHRLNQQEELTKTSL